MNKLLAGIDVGTTGVRCMLFDSHGNAVIDFDGPIRCVKRDTEL